MRKMMVLATVVAALAMVSQPTEARDRGFGFRQFSGHAVSKPHLRHPGFKFHHGGFVGKPRSFKSRHFGHFGHRGFAFRFGHAPHFKPRHFGQFRHPGLVLKFGDGDVVLRFGHVPHFKDRHFGRRHHRHGLFFGFDQPRRFGRWHDHGFTFEGRNGVHARRQTMPESQGGQGGGLHDGAPPEALLEQLEQMGFRHVPELLRGRYPLR
jgi:hypothetical protein